MSFEEMMSSVDPSTVPEVVPPCEPLGPIQKVLRTPDARFVDLVDFPFKPNYLESRSHGEVRIHYLDEGPRDATETVLLMHGEPSWCYLYRHMIPVFVAAGFRVLAPDLVGFGKSDKPAHRADYSYERHVDWMADFVVHVGLKDCTCFLQDWGGLIGLRLLSRFPERFRRCVCANTGLPTGATPTGAGDEQRAPLAFRVWAGVISQQVPSWGELISGGCVRELSPAEKRAYDAPFPDESYKAGSRQFPHLVPQFHNHASVEENRGAWRRVLERFDRPFLTLFSDSDPVSKDGERTLIARIPGAKGMPHEIIKDAGHFLQEDKPLELGEKVLAFIRANPPLLAKL